MPTLFLPARTAATEAVPVPRNGSSTVSPTNENMRTSRVASSRGYGAGCCLVDAPGIVQICRNHSWCSAAEITLSTRTAGDRTDAESLQTPGPSLPDRSQHPSELLDIIGRIAAVQHRVTVWADRDQIGFRVHRVRGSHSVQRTLVVDVNEALARFAVPLLETQVAYRASQTMMVDAGVTRLGVPLVAIHRHSLDIPFLVDILLAQLTDCCWLMLIPTHADHRFRFKPITDSDAWRSRIPTCRSVIPTCRSRIPMHADHSGVSE